jgi:long-chain acyl-CoA synthetase
MVAFFKKETAMTRTLPKMIKDVAERFAREPALYYRNKQNKYVFLTFETFHKRIEQFACGLLSMGVKRGDHIGIISDNRKEWIISDFAILGIGAADVPRGTDATDAEIGYILNHSECGIVLAENRVVCDRILGMHKNLPKLKTIIVMDEGFILKDLKVKKGLVKIKLFAEVLEAGEKKLAREPELYNREMQKGGGYDLATIIYTSGTTGEPKGVMICHENFLHQVRATLGVLYVYPQHICLSVLPVWHSFERAIEYVILSYGAKLAYSKPVGSIMLADIAEIGPQWLPSVPRIWEGVWSAVYRKIREEGGARFALFKFFISIGKAHAYFSNMLRGLLPQFNRRIRIVDIIIGLPPFLLLLPLKLLGGALVFSKIKEKIGHGFVAGISGGGALPPYVDKFFQAVGILLLEGYGLTEASPVISVRLQKRPVPNTVGPLLRETEGKILDENGKKLPPGKMGVLYVKGGQVMLGYYKKPAETDAVLTADGWLNTGDLAMFTHKGELKIVGRVKDTIVLRGGENVEPQPIEETVVQSLYIDQVIVLGQDQKFLAALVVVNDESIREYAAKAGIPYQTVEELRESPEIYELITMEINTLISPKTGFKVWERIFRIKILPAHFEVGNELTSSLKMKRQVINKIYKKQIAELFR